MSRQDVSADLTHTHSEDAAVKRAGRRVPSCIKHSDSGAGSVITSRSGQEPVSG